MRAIAIAVAVLSAASDECFFNKMIYEGTILGADGGVPSMSSCLERCAARPGCVAVSFRKRDEYCRFYSNVTGLTKKGVFSSAKLACVTATTAAPVATAPVATAPVATAPVATAPVATAPVATEAEDRCVVKNKVMRGRPLMTLSGQIGYYNCLRKCQEARVCEGVSYTSKGAGECQLMWKKGGLANSNRYTSSNPDCHIHYNYTPPPFVEKPTEPAYATPSLADNDCWIRGASFTGQLVDEVTITDEHRPIKAYHEKCSEHCKDHAGCDFWSSEAETRTCRLMTGKVAELPRRSKNWRNHVSGPKDCRIDKVTYATGSLGLVQYPREYLKNIFQGQTPDLSPDVDVQFTHDYTRTARDIYPGWSHQKEPLFTDKLVHHATITVKDSSALSSSYEYRVGKGTQPYSIQGVWGELVSFQSERSCWVDRVFQFNSGRDNAPIESWGPEGHYYKPDNHGAGQYNTAEKIAAGFKEPFFAPILDEHWDQEARTYYTIHWPQISHANINVNYEEQATYLRSDVVAFTKLTFIGDGLIQADVVLYNFDDSVIYSAFSVPHGSVDGEAFPHIYRSFPDKPPALWHDGKGDDEYYSAMSTDGYYALCMTKDGEAPCFGVHFGREQSRGGAKTRQVWRNMGYGHSRSTVVSRRHTGPVHPGEQYDGRWYYVFADSISAFADKTHSYDLSQRIKVERTSRAKDEVPDVSYKFKRNANGSVDILRVTRGGHITLKPVPYANSTPLFIMETHDGRLRASSDLLVFSELNFDGVVKSWRILGFRDEKGEVDLRAFF